MVDIRGHPLGRLHTLLALADEFQFLLYEVKLIFIPKK